MGGSTTSASDHATLAEQVRESATHQARTASAWPMTKGILRGIEDGWFMSEIAEAAFHTRSRWRRARRRSSASTATRSRSPTTSRSCGSPTRSRSTRSASSRAARAERDQAVVDAAIARLVEVARTEENMIPAMLDACRVEATLGEICDALRAEWGEYREPARF